MNDVVRDEVPNRYFDPHFKIETAKILPGEYYATNKDMALVTVLGSCVSACLRSGITQRRARLMLIALLFVLLGTLRRKALHFTGVVIIDLALVAI